MYSFLVFLTDALILAYLKSSVFHTAIKTKWSLMAHPAKTKRQQQIRRNKLDLYSFYINTVHYKFVSD